jgi:hypothetical protein
MKRLVIVRSDSAVPWSQSTLASVVPYCCSATIAACDAAGRGGMGMERRRSEE